MTERIKHRRAVNYLNQKPEQQNTPTLAVIAAILAVVWIIIKLLSEAP